MGLIWFSSASIFIGTTFSHFIGKKAIRFITSISDATKKVAKGDFNVKVDEDIKVKELNQMAQNFNLMIHELASMEMFRNDFINNVSHEFKTPLAAVEGYATLLQNKNISEEKRQAYISKILYNTSRLSELTENILLISRLENQNISISKSEFSLDEQIRQIILLFEQDWTNKNINLDIDLDKVDYLGNEELLAQVWQNIIGNAMKFTHENGSIQISMKKYNNNITVIIADNGIGMDKDTQSRIFEKFYQGDKSHTLKGNGLGLALTKQIIDLHKGNIFVLSQEGKGSTFEICLPIN
ncbi:HAMP domain-containing sensor histidine kinase [Intestinibacter bartlettii]|nr:HAMP domain-containing sensor histidine kinase [Intestinibacter bartlettii]